MVLIDLYSQKYTGEFEAILIEKNKDDQIVYQVRLFQADFNIIIGCIPYDGNSGPDNLVRILNTNLDWGEEFSEVLRVQEFYDQLKLLVGHIDPQDLPVLNAIKNICISSLKHENRLLIKVHD